MLSNRSRLVSGLLVAALGCAATTACGGGDSGSGGDPRQRLTSARKTIDDAQSIKLSLRTDQLPSDVEGIESAEGVGTHEPAFDGDATVHAFGITGKVPVTAIGGQVYVKLPFKSDYETFDLAKYDAPDPATLLDRRDGVSSMITALRDVHVGDAELDGRSQVTPIEGTLPGSRVSTLFPAVDDSDDFDVTFRLDDDDVLHDATITGPFYAGADDVTYTISLSASDQHVHIAKPT